MHFHPGARYFCFYGKAWAKVESSSNEDPKKNVRSFTIVARVMTVAHVSSILQRYLRTADHYFL